MPRIARVACISAFVMAGLTVLSAFIDSIIVLPLALIPLTAGIGVLRKRAWSAYGFALYQFAQLLLLIFVVVRSGSTERLAEITVAAVLLVILIPLFTISGRSLARMGTERGWAFPWIAVSLLTTLPLFFIQPFIVPSGAMENTILIGDRILVQRFPKPTLERGDMIAFVYPVDRRQTFIKRIVGVPGDRIKISGKALYRNGEAIQEPYAIHKSDYMDLYRDNFPSEPNAVVPQAGQEMLERHVVSGEVVVPGGKYFVLGDNRDQSLDSRYWGFVDLDDIIGKPLMIYQSEDQSTQEIPDGTSSPARRIRWERFFKLL